MRQLTLHASALNDAEYELYTTSLQDLAWTEDQASSSSASGHDDTYYEQMRVSVREVRAWIRGRYAHISPASIDNILRLFSPGMGVLDELTGGQFFVTLRLVLHAETGNDVNRSLAFVQAHPSTTSPSTRRNSSPERKPDSISLASIQDFPASAPPTSQVFSQKRLQPYSPSFTNPFTLSNTNTDPDSQFQPLPQPSKSPTPSSRSSHAIHNPFASYLHVTGPAPEPPKLPPRKPLLIPPPVHPVRSNPRHSPRRKSVSPSGRTMASPRGLSTPSPSITSLSQRSASLSPTKSRSSTLIQEGLEASRAARETKKHGKMQEDEPVLQVLKSSSVISGGYSLSRARVTGSSVVVGTSVHNRGRSRGTSPARVDDDADGDSRATQLPRRRSSQQQQPSPPGSVSSFEHVAPPSSAAVIPHGTPPPLQSPLPPSSPSRRYSASNPYHKRPLPIPGNNATVNGLYRSPQSSPTRSFFDLPKDTHGTPQNSQPAHFRYRSPSSSSSASSTFTFINHADALPDAPSSSFGPAFPSNPLATPTKSGFLSFHNPPAPSRSPFHNPSTPIPLTPQSPSPRPPRTPTKYPGLALSPFSYPTSNSPLPTTPQNANDPSPSARIFRSKSVHQPSPPLPPLPASARSGGVRRKRPESVLVLSSGEILFGNSNAHSGVQDEGVSVDDDAAQNHDNSETSSWGKEDHNPSRSQERYTLPSGSSSGDERRRLSLSRSISVSSVSTNQTTSSQPLPDAYSHSPRSQRSARLDRPRPLDQRPTQGPTQDSISGQHIPDKSLSSLSSIQRTIAKFDAYAVQSKHAAGRDRIS